MLQYLQALRPAAPAVSRRGFLKMSAGAAGGLMLGGLTGAPADAEAHGGMLATPFVHIRPDNSVVVIVKHLDMGQGNATGLATLVAEELDAAPAQLTTEFAPSDPETYNNLWFGPIQGTGGSTALGNSWEQYRRAGAAARAMVVAAAARQWAVDPADVTVSDGTVSAGGNQATLGELATAAAGEEVPAEPALKSPEQWKLIGADMPRVDVPAKSGGSVGMFGMDARPEDMAYAAVLHPPRFGAAAASVDDAAARAMPGVIEVLNLPQGVAVVADGTWNALRARDALAVEWDVAEAEGRGTDALEAEFTALLDQPGATHGPKGDPAGKLAGAARTVGFDYLFPYLAHAPMEPLNVTVRFDGAAAELWFGSQIQTLDHNFAAGALGVEFPMVKINTMWAGGSFGRRATPDAHLAYEAATLAKAFHAATGETRPIKMVWSREDDVRGGYYRPLVLHRVRAGVDADGRIAGWEHRIVGQSIGMGTPFEEVFVKDGIDASTTEGIADTPYEVADMSVDVHHPKVGVPVLWWRSVGHTHSGHVMETMMDALAEAAGADPVAFRLAHLAGEPRMAGVLTLAAEKAGPEPEGTHRGIAVHKSFNSYVAEIADIRMREDGSVRVERVTAAVDCGVPVNPDNIRAQVQSAVGYGLSAILREEITLTDGEVDQSNFPDYEVLRIGDMPEVDVHIVQSAEAPTGIGEPGLPPLGPAVANAVYRATGKRITRLPFSKHGLA